MLGDDPAGSIYLIGLAVSVFSGVVAAVWYWLITPEEEIDSDRVAGTLVTSMLIGIAWPAVIVLGPIAYGLNKLKQRIHAEQQ